MGLKPEEKACVIINDILIKAGWTLQEYKSMNVGAHPGVAVREYSLPTGRADYMLFLNGKPAGVIEAKKAGVTLGGVEGQAGKYSKGVELTKEGRILFEFVSNGEEIYFSDNRDLNPLYRKIFAFFRPETLAEWAEKDSFRNRLKFMPPLITDALWKPQTEAIIAIEKSLAENRQRAVMQMATGSGKTFTAANFIYRLIKYAGAKRVLFLVDRRTLGRQAHQEFEKYETPDDHRKFTELYVVQQLKANKIDKASKVCITTIQRLFSMLKGEQEYEETLEDNSAGDLFLNEEIPVTYNPDIPIETFDFIITDECHRSIYKQWRQVLEYFDGFITGLTATPSKQTLGFFRQNLVMEYTHARAVAEGINVPYEIYRIKTELTEKGGKVDAGYYVGKRNKLTRQERQEQLDSDLEYGKDALDRSVVAQDQIRTVLQEYKNKLFTDLFPGRTEVPKTLIFCKDDSHAEDVLRMVREVFPDKPNDFVKKITYLTTEDTEDLIASYRTSYFPRIAVTVDMISTGTDVKPLEVLIFMRDVRSLVLFEQMKGRGTRVIDPSDLKTVTPDAVSKDRFVIVDAVGATESEKSDSQPLEKKRSISFVELITAVSKGTRDPDMVISLGVRFSILDKKINDSERLELRNEIGKPLNELALDMIELQDFDVIMEKAKVKFKTDSPTEKQTEEIINEMIKLAVKPLKNKKLVETLICLYRKSEQTIDEINKDRIISSDFSTDEARQKVESFKEFIKDNKNELDALQIIYGKSYKQRHLTYEIINKLADAIKRPPYNLTPEVLWMAYEKLEKAKIRGSGPLKLLTNIISLVRFAINDMPVLEPFTMLVDENFGKWVKIQESIGRKFTEEQKWWLENIKEHIASSGAMEMDDFDLTPFSNRGGLAKADKVFVGEVGKVVEELNEVLVA